MCPLLTNQSQPPRPVQVSPILAIIVEFFQKWGESEEKSHQLEYALQRAHATIEHRNNQIDELRKTLSAEQQQHQNDLERDEQRLGDALDALAAAGKFADD